MDAATQRLWLSLIRAPEFGPLRLRELLNASDRPLDSDEIPAWVARHHDRLPARARAWLDQPDEARLDADQAWLAQPDNWLVTYASADYPPLLRELDDAPLALFVTGDPTWLSMPQLAIVGSRNPTHQGMQTAGAFGEHLAQAGIVVTSGMATGIDGAAHRGALRAGHTIAVTGTGLDRVYPARHRELAREIAGHGALVSEFPPGTPARPGHFPRRNRIISGLSLGVLVVEAAVRSGSLISARLAGEQGREVFAVPGSIHNPLARGCHQLIRNGATLVETGADIVEELGSALGGLSIPETAPAPTSEARSDRMEAPDAEYQQLLKHMGYDPISVDELVSRSKLPAEAISSMLLLLELQGRVSTAPGGRYCRTSSEVVSP
ncbi:MAG TPA: DNA-protecting protein DprA [Chromatiaceae bacterium]|nr:DNA-protecting protein DprA [Chromatiaceae bacterium]